MMYPFTQECNLYLIKTNIEEEMRFYVPMLETGISWRNEILRTKALQILDHDDILTLKM